MTRAIQRARRRGQGGFTLIELTVSLLAGLIVAIGIMGLSRDATHTFHEEMRGSVAEANLRTAVDRLRADLARAGYMSTGNVYSDPMIAKLPGVANPITNPGLAGLARLTSIMLDEGDTTGTPTPLSAINGVAPDAIEIGGNMTTTDQYEVSLIQPGGAGGCQTIFLNATSPSMFRILGLGAAGATELNNIFQPTPDGTGSFIVRLVDKTGHTQFLATCPGVAPTGIGAGGAPFILVNALTPVQLAAATGTVGGLNGYGSGAQVNPVQIVRWELLPATSEPAQYQNSPLGGQPLTPTVVDPTKYDLVRSFVDAVTGKPIPATVEVVAEYAVDLSFAFSVDQGISNLQPNIVTFPFGMAAGTGSSLWAQNITIVPPVGQVGPEKIRSVRVRLATRASEPDRTLTVAVPNSTGGFMYRYCVLPGGCPTPNTAGVQQFARARTVTAEVSLPNQSRFYY
jgi:hypothetical protein